MFDQTHVSDAILVARVLRGLTDEFGWLVRRYQDAMYRHALSIVLDHDAAADLVQDAFVRAYTSLRACRDASRFRPWLFQVLRRRCFDYLKDVRRRHVRLDDAGPIADRTAGPEALAQQNRLRADLARALAALPARQREAFVLHYVHETPYEEMAELVGSSVSALKMRVLRAREALGAALAADVTGPAAGSSLSQARVKRG